MATHAEKTAKKSVDNRGIFPRFPRKIPPTSANFPPTSGKIICGSRNFFQVSAKKVCRFRANIRKFFADLIKFPVPNRKLLRIPKYFANRKIPWGTDEPQNRLRILEWSADLNYPNFITESTSHYYIVGECDKEYSWLRTVKVFIINHLLIHEKNNKNS